MEIFLRPDTAITLSPCCFSGEKWSFPTSLEVENTISQSYYSLQVMLMVSPLFLVVVGGNESHSLLVPFGSFVKDEQEARTC